MGPYDTPLSPRGEELFKIWKQHNAPDDTGEDYDLRGAFAGGLKPAENHHWSDEFKKPNHPTFSDESRYSNPEHPGGHWYGDEFVPFGPRPRPPHKGDDAMANPIQEILQMLMASGAAGGGQSPIPPDPESPAEDQAEPGEEPGQAPVQIAGVEPVTPGMPLEQLIELITRNNESLRQESSPKPYTSAPNADMLMQTLQRLGGKPG